jgi:Na+/H+ antiporter NhaD/arsenite permease-like protein
MSGALLSDTAAMWLAGLILLATYGLIFFEIIHRTSAAVIGAVVMVGAGSLGGFYSQEQALMSIDANTLLLLTAMMMVVTMLRPTGGFDYLAIRIAKSAAGDPRRLMIFLTATVSLLSMVLDNVTTVIIFAPLTVLVTRILGLNPAPFLMAEAMLSNIGGAATLVGDPPNIMIGSVAGIDFTRFLIHMAPLVIVVWGVTVVLLLFIFRKALRPGAGVLQVKMDLDESKAIRDPEGLRRMLLVLALIVGLFFVHHRLHLYPAYVSFLGLALAMLLMRPDPESLFGKVHWSVLVFFAALFVVVGGVEHAGLLALVGQQLARIAQDPALLLMAALILMWMAAILSALVDNIPFTVTMLSIVAGLEASGVNSTPLWWALAIGVGLGGNGTHIGATANIICMAEAERSRVPEAAITPRAWLKVGMPVMFSGLLVSSLMFTLFFEFFSR